MLGRPEPSEAKAGEEEGEAKENKLPQKVRKVAAKRSTKQSKMAEISGSGSPSRFESSADPTGAPGSDLPRVNSDKTQPGEPFVKVPFSTGSVVVGISGQLFLTRFNPFGPFIYFLTGTGTVSYRIFDFKWLNRVFDS